MISENAYLRLEPRPFDQTLLWQELLRVSSTSTHSGLKDRRGDDVSPAWRAFETGFRIMSFFAKLGHKHTCLHGHRIVSKQEKTAGEKLDMRTETQ